MAQMHQYTIIIFFKLDINIILSILRSYIHKQN